MAAEGWWNREWAAVLALALSTAAVARPWSVRPGLVFTQGDTAYTLVNMLHTQDALMGRVPWSQGPLGWPLLDGVAQTDWTGAAAVATLPLRWLGVDPLQMHSVVVLVGLFLTAWVCHRLAVALLGWGPHTWLAGVVGGLGPLQLAHAQHLNLVHHEWVVGAGLLLGAGLHRRVPWMSALGAALAGLAFHAGVYLGVQAMLVVVGVSLVAAWAKRGNRASWTGVALGGAAGLVTALPVLAVFRRAANRYGVWYDAQSVGAESWDLAATLRPIEGVALHQPLKMFWPLLPTSDKVWIDPVNPGYGVTALAIVGAWLGWRRGLLRGWAWAAVGLLGLGTAALALGPELVFMEQGTGIPGPYALIAWLPGASGLRAPARWLAPATVAVGLLAALGLRELAGVAKGWLAVAVVGAALGLAVFETPTAHARPTSAIGLHPAYAMLDGVSEGGALLDEAAVVGDEPTCRRRHALRAAMLHGRPLVGGHYARQHEVGDALDALVARWPDPQAVDFLEATDVNLVLEHPPLRGTAPVGWSCTTMVEHRLCRRDERAERSWCEAPRGVELEPWQLLSTILGTDEVIVPCAKVRGAGEPTQAEGWRPIPYEPGPVRGPVRHAVGSSRGARR